MALVRCLVVATLVALCHCNQQRFNKPPNIFFLLTDDQDLMLGGNTPMAYTRNSMASGGAQLNNFFVNTPVCCPSRTTLLSGMYPHNWHTTTGGCMHMNVTTPAFQQSMLGVHMKKLYSDGHSTQMEDIASSTKCPTLWRGTHCTMTLIYLM